MKKSVTCDCHCIFVFFMFEQNVAKMSFVKSLRHLLNHGEICIEGGILLSDVLVSWTAHKMFIAFDLSVT